MTSKRKVQKPAVETKNSKKIAKIVKKIKSKPKGNKYEYETIKKICDEFGIAYGEDLRRKYAWEKGADSLHLTQEARRKFPYVIECKDYKDPRKWRLPEWWKKLLGDSKEKDLIPFMCLHRPGTRKEFVVLDFDDFISIITELSMYKEEEYWKGNKV